MFVRRLCKHGTPQTVSGRSTPLLCHKTKLFEKLAEEYHAAENPSNESGRRTSRFMKDMCNVISRKSVVPAEAESRVWRAESGIEDGQYEAWSFGVEVRVPAFGDIKGRRELAAARHRKQQALIHLKEAEIEIVNGLDAAIRKVAGSREQAENYKLVADFSRRVLDTELSRLDAGKSDSRKVLDVEDDLAEALSAEIESIVRHQTALLEYELAGGSLLRARQVEPLDLPDAGAVSPSRPPEPRPLLLHTPLR